MKNFYCPNYQSCKLVQSIVIVPDEAMKKRYLSSYCEKNEESWVQCKRYIAKSELNFCPDFVLPDTALSAQEIIDEFDRISLNH